MAQARALPNPKLRAIALEPPSLPISVSEDPLPDWSLCIASSGDR